MKEKNILKIKVLIRGFQGHNKALKYIYKVQVVQKEYTRKFNNKKIQIEEIKLNVLLRIILLLFTSHQLPRNFRKHFLKEFKYLGAQTLREDHPQLNCPRN